MEEQIMVLTVAEKEVRMTKSLQKHHLICFLKVLKRTHKCLQYIISSISASIDYVLYVPKETKAKAYITDNFGRSCCKTNEEINIRLMADKSSLQLELNNVIQKLGQKVRRIISYKINKLYNC